MDHSQQMMDRDQKLANWFTRFVTVIGVEVFILAFLTFILSLITTSAIVYQVLLQ